MYLRDSHHEIGGVVEIKPGDIDPDHIVTPGIYVQRIVHVPNAVKHIEQRTVRKRQSADAPAGTGVEV